LRISQLLVKSSSPLHRIAPTLTPATIAHARATFTTAHHTSTHPRPLSMMEVTTKASGGPNRRSGVVQAASECMPGTSSAWQSRWLTCLTISRSSMNKSWPSACLPGRDPDSSDTNDLTSINLTLTLSLSLCLYSLFSLSRCHPSRPMLEHLCCRHAGSRGCSSRVEASLPA
jgi:hypothetical protein